MSQRALGPLICRAMVIAGLLCFLFSWASTTKAGSSQDPAEAQWSFAIHLLDTGENYRAITEFKRFLFYFPRDKRCPLARLKILEAYVRGRSWREGVKAAKGLLNETKVRDIRARALYYKGLCELHLGRVKEGRASLEEACALTTEEAVLGRARYLIGESYAMEGAYTEAREAFGKVGSGGSLGLLAKRAGHKMGSAGLKRGKSPWTAGILAAVLPGAGHLYLRRYKDAALVAVVNGAFLAATLEAAARGNEPLTGGLAAVEAVWYGGNIFSAISSAHKHRRREGIRVMREIHPKDATLVKLPPLHLK